ncbi:tryptophan 7-halogenase, partial [Acinetobacter baumannii]
PLPVASFPFDITYGYHFDAHLVGAVLRDHAVWQGVRHLPVKVVNVAVGEGGLVEALVAEDGERITADIFVDCSGFRGVIAQEALGARFLP